VEAKASTLRGTPPDAPGYAAALLRLHQGSRSIVEIARSTGLQRLRVSRVLSGRTQARLPLFLQLLDALTGRMDEYVGAWVDLRRVPKLRERLKTLGSWREVAYDNPVSEAVTAMLESAAYQREPIHDDVWLATRLGISSDEVHIVLRTMAEAKLIHFEHGRWVPLATRSVDTRGDPERFAGVKRYWAQVAAERVEHNDAKAAYLVFCCSEEACAAVEQLYHRTWSEARAIVRDDTGNERVLLLNVNWVPLAQTEPKSGTIPEAR